MKAVITHHGFSSVDAERAALAAIGCEVIDSHASDEDAIIAAAADADALFVQFVPITAKVINQLKRCKIILRYGIGVDNVDLEAASALGIVVCNVPDYCTNEVADHAAAMALSLARQLPQTDAQTRSGDWSIVPPSPISALDRCTVATIGFGRIARLFHQRMAAFGCTGIAYDPFATVAPFATHDITPASLDACFTEADIISLHCPLTPATRHIVDAERLQTMRAGAILINTARGPLVDGTALCAALESGSIGGAGIDVFETEPLPTEDPLRRAPNAILTSHTAWNSSSSSQALQRLAGEEVARVLAGKEPRNPVNEVQKNQP